MDLAIELPIVLPSGSYWTYCIALLYCLLYCLLYAYVLDKLSIVLWLGGWGGGWVGVGGGAKGPGPDRLGFRPFRPGLGGGEGGGWGGGAGGPGPGQKFRSTLAKIAKILQENDIFLINTH